MSLQVQSQGVIAESVTSTAEHRSSRYHISVLTSLFALAGKQRGIWLGRKESSCFRHICFTDSAAHAGPTAYRSAAHRIRGCVQ